MTNCDYKKYSLENLEKWLHDALSTAEASPHEIYSTIREAVREDYNCYNEQAKKCFELLELLSGHRPVNLDYDVDDVDDGMRPWGHSDLEYLIANNKKEDKVVKWQLPVQQIIEEGIDNYFVQFPDDLLEAANLKEGDKIQWVDQGDGSYLLRKVEI
jgi:antitoxin component of MazEF toxin-antitoxin module